MLARLMESQIWHLPAISVALGGMVQKRANGLCLPFCLGESCPPAFALMPDTSVPPCMALVPFKLLPRCWSSDGLNLSVSLCVGSLRGTAWDSRIFFHQPIPAGFCSQKLWGLIFLALEPWAGWPGVGLGLLTPEISLLNFSPLHVRDQPVPCLCPSYHCG